MKNRKNRRWYVYHLICPLESVPKYIGMTSYPYGRYSAHLSGENNLDINKWVAKLKKRGLKPEMVIIRKTKYRHIAQKIEKQQIKLHGDSHVIFNKNYNKDYFNMEKMNKEDLKNFRAIKKACKESGFKTNSDILKRALYYACCYIDLEENPLSN